MAEKKQKDEEIKAGEPNEAEGSTAVKPKRARTRKPKQQPPKLLPPWRVLLHNDDINTRQYVVEAIVELTPLKRQDAIVRMEEADRRGVALLLVTHKERAELYKEQFESKGLTVTIEPAEK